MILTQFNFWPEGGGILDQDPLFLRRLQQYTAVKNEYDEKKRAAEERKNPKLKSSRRR